MTARMIDEVLNNWTTEAAYTLSEAWSGVNWADLMAAQGAFGTDLYERVHQNDSRHDALDRV